jgi:hypothetical protein
MEPTCRQAKPPKDSKRNKFLRRIRGLKRANFALHKGDQGCAAHKIRGFTKPLLRCNATVVIGGQGYHQASRE